MFNDDYYDCETASVMDSRANTPEGDGDTEELGDYDITEKLW